MPREANRVNLIGLTGESKMIRKHEIRENWRGSKKYLILEQAEGYAKALGKSTSRVLSSREVYEPRAQNV